MALSGARESARDDQDDDDDRRRQKEECEGLCETVATFAGVTPDDGALSHPILRSPTIRPVLRVIPQL
jgi:hypothetical protein